ncbi:hypothetical protein MRS44_003883 [Fusarium solani]|uniref:uncharacterized protein n=1 Tax=Fusarium solani TaxID=169388 RepID=UPI0032C425EC|nr:hypothetical protein MRS44_003848 [Fusarium solani]KAJ3469818.1 hypothetical protein MRS44_003883 [Fusarium solani]
MDTYPGSFDIFCCFCACHTGNIPPEKQLQISNYIEFPGTAWDSATLDSTIDQTTLMMPELQLNDHTLAHEPSVTPESIETMPPAPDSLAARISKIEDQLGLILIALQSLRAEKQA